MSSITTGSAVVTDWCMEKANFGMSSAIRLCAACKAGMLLIVRRWNGTTSSLSSSSSDSMSDKGMSSASEPCSLPSSSFVAALALRASSSLARCLLLFPCTGFAFCIVGSLASVRSSSPSLELSVSSMRSRSN